ncbi:MULTISPECIES: hypothetical protein [Vibrio]|uniref:hypothetical protein n=1 Tax=Vibrio TaxID=662 RepID=UPI00337D7738|nr:hypothetical protein VCHA34P112_70002 [Vibrio chagasii]CAH7115378.1 hypothetical protein VCHA50P417_250051 [Vibrio chagasii]CAH7281817.1 hypothetical protein VCHA40O235_50002 [Vibrio chagasii]CAH7306068.1 hypothetical protein VCHA43P273_450021 [Vibrio chagasii]CAH7332888.1 hypothetical protein VCHA54O482_220050 [Vibrio chagasii]
MEAAILTLMRELGFTPSMLGVLYLLWLNLRRNSSNLEQIKNLFHELDKRLTVLESKKKEHQTWPKPD